MTNTKPKRRELVKTLIRLVQRREQLERRILSVPENASQQESHDMLVDGWEVEMWLTDIGILECKQALVDGKMKIR